MFASAADQPVEKDAAPAKKEQAQKAAGAQKTWLQFLGEHPEICLTLVCTLLCAVTLWYLSRDDGKPVSCILADIDMLFCSVNHSSGEGSRPVVQGSGSACAPGKRGTATVAVLSRTFSSRHPFLSHTPSCANPHTHPTMFLLQRLFDPEALKLYDGKKNAPMYLAILGSVFDVTKGRKKYDGGCGVHARGQ